MILIDALYINGGGAKVLLDYLLSKLEERENDVTVLIDNRIAYDRFYTTIKSKVIFMDAGLMKRRKFYSAHKNDFSSVLCFSNLPPSVKLNAKVITYFHQPLYLKIPVNFSLKSKILYSAKISILKSLVKNTDLWLVQSGLIKNEFKKKYKVNNVEVLPFYPPLPNASRSVREKNTYLFVSNATDHKNHKNLIEAFCKFFDKQQVGKLILTVSDFYAETFALIGKKIDEGYPIENIGFVKRDELGEIYQNAEYLIYPSLAESFGLGLLEAVDQGCKVIGADLPYTYAVCEPSLTFNPHSIDSVVDALSLSLQNDVKPSVNKVSDQIDELISLLEK